MRHMGDITKINGADIPPGARSGLYMEQIRVTREMREHDRRMGRTGELVRPRYMVWENVPGAFSSNGGKDFTAVLEEVIRWTDLGEWTDSKGKKHKDADSPRYKALGNSIALPPWKWLLKRICAQYTRNATMASLFDGIGGFPLIWEQLNGAGSCLWASEIEEFPMAVTRRRFGNPETGEIGDMGRFLFPCGGEGEYE